MKKIEVRIPEHVHNSIKCPASGDVRTIRVTKRRSHFKCTVCGEVFPIAGNICEKEQESVPKCIHDDRGYVCSISGLNLDYDKDGIHCPHACYGCKYPGTTLKEIARYDQGFVPGYYVETTPLPKTGAGRQKMHIPPLDILRDLGCKGIVLDENINSNEFEDIAEFEFDGELHQITPIGNNLYDIGHGRFWLYHKYECVKTRQKHNVQHYKKDKTPTHVCCFIDKETMKTFVIPNKNVKIFGFQFKRGTLYRYIPSTGLNLANPSAFKDNTKFLATSVLDTNYNDVTNKDEDTWGYLVIDKKFDEFMSLTKRTTRIISSDDYSGIPEHDKKILSACEYTKGERTLLEAIEDDCIYQKYVELLDLDPIFNVNITEFDNVDPALIQEERNDENIKALHFFGELIVQDFDETLTDFVRPWSKKDYDDRKDLYDPVNEFINKYCKGLCGKTEDVLYHLYCDAVDPNNVEFTRWIDDFNGGKENEEYYRYSNKDLIQASKVKHVLKLVHLSSPQNIKAIEDLFAKGVQHISYGNPLKSGKAQGVAFDFVNPVNNDDDFQIYDNLGELMKDDPDLSEPVKIYGSKPRSQWSDKDYARAEKGEAVKEIKTMIIGVNASEDDLITKHCLDTINGHYTPLPLVNISVSGSRVMPTGLRTRYIKNDEIYGRGYFTPAVHVWKGYLTNNNIKVLFARIAPGSDCSAIIAALEINEELANRLQAGIITAEEYEEQSIKIVAILHGWFASATFNNPGLMSILHKVLHYHGYVVCNEPYRKNNVTSIRYPKKIETHTVVMKVPVTLSNYTQLLSNMSFTHDIFIQVQSTKNDVHNPIYTHFDRRIERTNKLLVSLGEKLVILCRSEYSGTTNTMNFALDLGKEVIEITSPYREIPERFRSNTLKPDEALKMYHRFCYLSENDPIQKGRSTPTNPKEAKESPQRKYNRMISPKIKAKFFYYKLAYIPMEFSNDHWNLYTFFKPQQYQLRGSGIMTSLRGQKHNHHEKISYIPMKEYMDKRRFDLWKFFEPQQYQLRDKYSSYYQVMKVVPATIKNYDKWSNIIASTIGNFRSRSTTSYIHMNYYVDSNHRDLCSIFS